MKINENYCGLKVEANLQDRVCVFHGDSGQGKSFLFDLIKTFCNDHKISCTMISSKNSDVLKKLDLTESSVFILDNADLYMSNVLFSKIKNSNSLFLISAKYFTYMDRFLIKQYKVQYEGTEIKAWRR